MVERGKTFGFVSLELYPTTVGGAGILLHHTISALLRKGHRIVLYLDLAEHEIRQFDQRDRHTYPNSHLLSFYDVRGMAHALEFCRALYEDSEQFRSVSIAHAILRTQGQHDLDLIEFYDYCGPAFHYLSYPASQRRPVAIRFHNTVEIIERGTRSAFHKRRLFTFGMERAQLALADLVLSPGARFLEEEIRKLYSLELMRQEVMVAPPIHTSIGRVTYNVESRRVLFYGRLSTFKGLDTFINAAVIALRDPAFRSWLQSFVIAGPEETVASALTLDEMKSVIPADLAEKFQFVGRLTHNQLMEVLGDISFACFANRMESFCYAAHELHTAGIPLILADRPAFRDHFTEEDVVFFDRSASGLAAEMVTLAANPKERVQRSTRTLSLPETDTADLYLDFAERAGKRLSARRDAVSPASTLLTVFILSDGKQESEELTIASLAADGITTYVMRLSDTGNIAYAGLRWSVAHASDMLAPVSIAYMFVRAGDLCHSDVLLEAAKCLVESDQVGAIAPWCEIQGRVRAAPHIFVPEYGPAMGPGLRTVIRAPRGATVIELLRSGSFADESSALLAQRAEGRGLTEKPMIGMSIGDSVYLPASMNDPSIDYDRMSPIYLALSRGLILSASMGARETIRMPRVNLPGHDFISLRATDAFGEGELWILRVFSQRGAMHEPWSAVEQFGDWMLINEPHSPAGGALKTYNGEICFWAHQGYGIEFLFGPFCGGVEIRWRDCVYHLRLRHDFVNSTVVWLDDLARGLFQPPQKGRPPIREIGRPLLSEATTAWIQTNVGPSTRTLTLTQNPALVTAGPKNPVVQPAELVGARQYSTGDLVFALLAAVAMIKDCVVHLPFGLPNGAAVADLFLSGGTASVAVDIDEQMPGQTAQAAYRALASWVGIAGKHQDRLKCVGSNEDLLFPLEAAGARVTRRRCRLPACLPSSPSMTDEVDIAILPSDGLIDNVAHMIAGAAFLSDHGINVRTLFLPENQDHAALVCETLSAARSYVTYNSLEHVAMLPRQRPIVACAVYPDPAIPSQGIKALALGIPALFGPVGRSKRFSTALREMSLPFWEDSRDIGQALAKLVTERDAILRKYNNAVAKQG